LPAPFADQFIQHHLQDCKQFIFALFIKPSLREGEETKLRHDRQEDDIATAR